MQVLLRTPVSVPPTISTQRRDSLNDKKKKSPDKPVKNDLTLGQNEITKPEVGNKTQPDVKPSSSTDAPSSTNDVTNFLPDDFDSEPSPDQTEISDSQSDQAFEIDNSLDGLAPIEVQPDSVSDLSIDTNQNNEPTRAAENFEDLAGLADISIGVSGTGSDQSFEFDSDQGADRTSMFNSAAHTSGSRDEIAARQAKKSDRHANAIGTMIGEYQVMSELGRGGMGVVYKARHQTLNRDVALKMILSGEHIGKEALRRFQLEAQAVAKLQHPNIVQIFDINSHEGLPFFSLEFVDGETLKEMVEDEPLSSRAAAKVLLTLAEAMQYAHDNGIVHRDIKPANILMKKDGTPKISDFGLAKVVDGDSSRTREGQIMGTPSYMSPEQAKGLPDQLGPATDQYSLGALLYRLVSGRAPFVAAKPFETVMQVIKNEPVTPRQLQPSIAVDLETICLKTLQKEPSARYANCTELAKDLRRFIDGEPISARPVSGLERAWRWCKRNPRVAIPSAAAVALMVCTTAISTWAYSTVSAKNKVIEVEKENAIAQEKIAQEQKRVAIQQTEIAEEKTKVAVEQAENGLSIIQDTLRNVNDRLSPDPKLNDLRIEISKSLSKSMEKIDSSVFDDEQGQVIPTLMAIRQDMIGIFKKEGKYQEALADVKKLYSMGHRRIVVKEGSDAARLNLARIAQTYSGLLDSTQSEPELAHSLLNESLSLLQDIIDNPKPNVGPDTPQAWDIQMSLGAILQNLGANHYKRGELEAFNDCFTKSKKCYEDWMETFPAEENFLNQKPEVQKQTLSNITGNIGRMRMGLATYQLKTSNFEGAFENYDSALATAKAKFDLETKSPMDRVNYQQMNDMYGFNKLKVAMLEKEHREERIKHAEELLEQGLELSKALTTDYEKSTDLKYHLSLAYYRMGVLQEFKSDVEGAKKSFEMSRKLRAELNEKSPSEKHSNMLMVATARSGDWEAAKKMADEKALADPDGAQWVRIARGYAIASTCEDAPQDELVAAAMSALNSAVAAGFSDWFDLYSEPDLDGVKSLPAFKELIASMKQKSKNKRNKKD